MGTLQTNQGPGKKTPFPIKSGQTLLRFAGRRTSKLHITWRKRFRGSDESYQEELRMSDISWAVEIDRAARATNKGDARR